MSAAQQFDAEATSPDRGHLTATTEIIEQTRGIVVTTRTGGPRTSLDSASGPGFWLRDGEGGLGPAGSVRYGSDSQRCHDVIHPAGEGRPPGLGTASSRPAGATGLPHGRPSSPVPSRHLDPWIRIRFHTMPAATGRGSPEGSCGGGRSARARHRLRTHRLAIQRRRPYAQDPGRALWNEPLSPTRTCRAGSPLPFQTRAV